MSNTPSHLKRKREEFEKDALELLTCPICFEHLSDPTYQCIKGHIICSACYQCISITSQPCCPQCRCVYDPQNLINHFFNEMLSYFKCPCKYVEYGCKEELNLGNRRHHEINCSFNRWIECPKIFYFMKNNCIRNHYCPFTGPIYNIIQHFQSAHRMIVNESSENKIYISMQHLIPEIQIHKSWLLKLPSGYLYTNISFYDRYIFIVLFTGSTESKKVELEFRSSKNQNIAFSMSMDSELKSGYQEWVFYIDSIPMREYLGPNSGFLLSIKEK